MRCTWWSTASRSARSPWRTSCPDVASTAATRHGGAKGDVTLGGAKGDVTLAPRCLDTLRKARSDSASSVRGAGSCRDLLAQPGATPLMRSIGAILAGGTQGSPSMLG
jgi:hypothetical protein